MNNYTWEQYMDSENNRAFSLLYPDPENRGRGMKESAGAASDLGFAAWFGLKSAPLEELLSCDPDVIRYRADTLRDVMDVPELTGVLKKCVPIMADMGDIRRLSAGADQSDEYIYGMTEVELYVSLLDLLKSDLLPLRDRLASEAMKKFCGRVFELCESEYYKEINERLAELTWRVREIKSVTLGVNLDSRLSPESAGLLAVGNDRFKSGAALERILRLDRGKDGNTFIAPIVKAAHALTDPEAESLRAGVMSALGTVFKTSFKSWKRIVGTYVLENTDFIFAVLPEIEFLVKASAFLEALKARGVKLTFPTVVPGGKTLRAAGLINPRIALLTDGELVPNDVDFDGDAGIYVITGPNRGGKSVFTCAVGQAVVMASLGLPVCADSFEFSPCDNVFCHFPTGEEDTVDKGRLGEECSRLSDILSDVTGESLVLLDESLSSTGADEASAIAGEVLAALSVIGCRAVFSTHLHSLAAGVGEINSRTSSLGGVKIDNLVADIESGERTFKVVRRAPVGKSFATDVAGKYGLSLGDILEKVKKNGKTDVD